MLATDKINCNLDFERDTRQFGNLELSFSDNEYAFDKIPVPVVNNVMRHLGIIEGEPELGDSVSAGDVDPEGTRVHDC